VLPALWAAWDRPESASQPLGDLLAANTFGGIAGALAAGFAAIPALGCAAAFSSPRFSTRCSPIWSPHLGAGFAPRAAVVLLAIVLADPMRAPIAHLRSTGETLRASYEGPGGIVTVVDSGGDLQLRLDNFYVLGGAAAAANQRRQGLLPLLLHRDPQRVAFVGLATGVTASAGPALGVPATTAVELVPEVAAAARDHFAPWNGDLFERGDVQVVVGDGRRFLAGGDETFDVIVADLFIPWHAGAGTLYSQETFASARRRLAHGGLFCQWLPLYQLTREEFDMIARTFLAVFPHTSLWRDDFYPDRPVVALAGRLEPETIDLDRVAERLAALPAWARDPLLVEPRGLAMLHAGELAPAAGLFARLPSIATTSRCSSSWHTRLTRIGTSGDKDWFTGDALGDFYERLAAIGDGAADPSLPDTADVADARRAGRALYRYALATAKHDRGRRRAARSRGARPRARGRDGVGKSGLRRFSARRAAGVVGAARRAGDRKEPSRGHGATPRRPRHGSGGTRTMRTRHVLLLLGLGLLAGGCAKPFTAPAKSVTSVAVLPPSNRTGDPLLVAGGTFLEEYAFKTRGSPCPRYCSPRREASSRSAAMPSSPAGPSSP
jgi:hypothetical protein